MREGWKAAKLEDIAQVVNGGTPKTKVTEYWDGDHLWITPAEMGGLESPYIGSSCRKLTDAGLKNTSASLLPKNSVILSTRAPIGHLVINTEPMAFNQGCRGLIPRADVDYKYLYYFLYGSVELLNELGSGTTFKELSAGRLKKVDIPVPPLPEQKRIVAILDEAFAGIDTAVANTEKNLANARELFESYLDNIFYRLTFGKTQQSLKELCAPESITYGVIKLGNECANGVPCLRTSNVRRLRIDTSNIKRIDPELSRQYSRTILKAREVLVNVRGTLGGVAVVTSDMTGWNVSREVAVVPVRESKVLPEFVAYSIATRASQEWLAGVQKGVAYTGINLTDLRELNIPVPSIKEQRYYAAKLDEMVSNSSAIERRFRQKWIALTELKQSLLQKAFSGELTATPQDEIEAALA